MKDDETAPPHRSLFATRIPFIQLITQDHQFALERMHDGLYQWLGHYQQMMLLEAGIVGVVIPLVFAQGPKFVNPWFLRRAVAWTGLSLFVGVLICGVSKWVLVLIMSRLQVQFAKQDQAIADGEDEASIAAGLQATNLAFRPEARKLLQLTYSGVFADLLFYGPFLAGLYYLLRGFFQA